MRVFKFILIFCLLLSGALGLVIKGRIPAEAASIDSTSLMEKINQERQNRAIPPLTTSSKLASVAAEKTADMFSRGYFDHINPDGNYVWPLIEKQGYKPYTILGENLAIDFSTEEGIIKAWINSPTHRDNLLKSQFFDQGLNSSYGTYQNRYTNLVTSLFGTLASIKQTAAAVPSSQIKPQQQQSITAESPPDIVIKQKAAETEIAEKLTADNEPAVQFMNPIFEKIIDESENQFEIADLKSSNQETNLFRTVTFVFIAIAILLFFTLIGDTIIHGRAKGLWDGEKTGILLCLLITFLASMRLY